MRGEIYSCLSQEKAHDLLLKASEYEIIGDYATASSYLELVLEIEPENEAAKKRLGQQAVKAKHQADAAMESNITWLFFIAVVLFLSVILALSTCRG